MRYNTATGQLTSVDVPDDGTYAYTYYPTTGHVDTVTGPAGTTAIQTLWQSDLPVATIATGPVPGRVDVTGTVWRTATTWTGWWWGRHA
ncbi:MAG: hypothetical protein R3B40_29305 [Polyangiales bacterium]|nr:hypothetical protein [Myxococcales bacterium]MCB9656489.1 hypothetical protein [Sandaracinaceae bacterium]